MAPETTNWQDLHSLATLLRDSGDRVLSGNSKLRLTPALLSKLNGAFSSISLLSSNGDFQVTSAHASQPPTTAQLHFLHDFVQKTVGLTIAGNGNHKSDSLQAQPVDLSCFRSLRHLEVRSWKQSDQDLEGLSSLRNQLEALVLLQIYQSDDLLWEVLAGGAVSVGPDVLWTKLSQLVVSYCGLRSFGRGLSLACNLQWLDVSHNMLSDADAVSSALASLPKLCYLNLSFNRLTKIPVPSYGSSYPTPTKLQILLLSHNYVESLNGLEHMTGLSELNLEVNQLQDHSSLQPLGSLYQLQHIRLDGNPISYHKRYRLIVSSYLHPRAIFPKHRYRRGAKRLTPFMLDGQKLSETEIQAVPSEPIFPNSSKSEHASINVSAELSTVPECSGHSSSEMENSYRKSRKAKQEAVIQDYDTLEELKQNDLTNQMTSSIESSGEHLQTKRQLETVKAQFKGNWLRAEAGSTVQELLGLQPSSAMAAGIFGSSVTSISSSIRPMSSSTPLASPSLAPSLLTWTVPYPGHLDDQALEKIILRKSPDSRDYAELAQTTQSTQYHTANDSDTVLHVSTGEEETLVKKNGPFFSEVGYDADEEEDEKANDHDLDDQEFDDLGGGDQSKFLATKISHDYRPLHDIFLVTSARYIKELDQHSGSVMQHWRLQSLESCVLLSASPCRVQLTFNTVVPSKKKRIYEMDSDEAQKQLLPALKAILETRSLSALNVCAFRCMQCSGEFSVELNSRKVSKTCPNCGSTLVFEVDETPVPSLGSSSQAVLKSDESGEATESTPVPQLSSELLLLHSPSDSSIGSAASLESPGSVIQPTSDYAATVNSGMRRCESDIDIISNPSQSSIEILDDVSRTSGTPGRKRSSEERQVVAIPSLLPVPEVSNPLSPLPAGLTESSSSGSITDSVCTAYENNSGTGGLGLRRGAQGLAKSVLKEESSRENSPRYKEESEYRDPSPQPTSLSNVLDNLLQTMSSKMSASESLEKRARKKNVIADSDIQYNYEDFSAVDHRLKLHLHMAVLDADERELLQLLFRGEVLTRVPENRYPGIFLISSQKVYVMKITGPEEGDAVDRWISRVVAIPREKLKSITALPWGSGIHVTLQGASMNSLIMVVQDKQYTHNFFNFLKNIPQEPNWKIEGSPPKSHHSAVTRILQDIIQDALPDADLSLKLVTLLCSFTISQDDEEQNHAGSLFVVTATSLLVNSGNLSWLMPPDSTPAVAPKCIAKQPMSNLIQVESDGDTLWLQFLDETANGDETWKLTPRSDSVLKEIVSAISTPWEKLFSVPLQVFHTNNKT